VHAPALGVAAVLLLVMVAASPPLLAQGLASPGPLSSAHARLDDLAHCLDCHDAGRQLTGSKCLACHGSLARQIRADQGYHAVATRHGTALACRSCHSEHNGRPFQIVKWPAGGRDSFDHRQTGWALSGAHAKERCASCHQATLVSEASVRGDASLAVARTYLGLGTACASCHLDEHRGRVSRQCENCHSVDTWKPAPRFDHGRTDFPLTGLHANVACGRCHAARADLASGPGGASDTSFVDFRASKSDRQSGCAGCHDSPHREAERVGTCEKCHATTGWFVLAVSERRFDHTTVGFPLNGAHATARCESCHLPSTRASLAPRVALVRANFVRPMARLKMVYDRCDACHADVHAGELSAAAGARDCSACHSETRFTPTRFSMAAHDSTRFPLSGAHRATPCAACHPLVEGAGTGSGRVRFRPASLSCATCHGDPHGRQFTGRHVPGSGQAAATEASVRAACTPCHDTEAWHPASFEHDSSGFPLRGAHRALACTTCHQAPVRGQPARFTGLPTTCDASGCHRDPHGGQFANRRIAGAVRVAPEPAPGRTACAACHDVTAWKTVAFDHDSTRYPLRGAHRTLACAKCHTAAAAGLPARFAGLAATCDAPGCHRDPHAGQFADRARGALCTSCHTEAAWASLAFDHQRDTDYPLDGAHRNVRCVACHRSQGAPPVARYRPLAHRCEDCHAAAKGGQSL
jgi:hypothetical protein